MRLPSKKTALTRIKLRAGTCTPNQIVFSAKSYISGVCEGPVLTERVRVALFRGRMGYGSRSTDTRMRTEA
jgi:hypothetical protein